MAKKALDQDSTHDALRESEERFRQLAENIREVFWLYDCRRDEIVYISPGYEAIWGQPRQHLYEDSTAWLKAILPEDLPRVEEAWARQKRGEAFEEVYRIVRPDGSILWIHDRGFPVRSDAGSVYRVAGIAEDITERKRAEEALKRAHDELEQCVQVRTSELTAANERLKREVADRTVAEEALRDSEERYRTLAENSAVGIWQVSPEGHTIYLNPAMCSMLQIDGPRDLDGRTHHSFFTAQSLETMAREHAKRPDGIPSIYEVEIVGRRGRRRNVVICGAPIQSPDGRLLSLIGTFIDITERKHAEGALRESEETIRALLNATTDAVLMIDAKGTVLAVNEALAERIGRSVDELIGRCIYDFLPPKVAEARRAKADEVFRSGKPLRYLDERDGKFLDSQLCPLFDAEGKVDRLAVFTGDITERRRAEEVLKYRSELENLIAAISTKFINLATDETDNGINDALRTLGEFVGVDRSYVFLYTEDGARMSNTHEWCARGVEPAAHRLQDLPANAFPWFAERMARFETVHVPRRDDLPPQARAFREELEAEAIQSLVCVPMVRRRKLIGFVGFDSVRAEKTWPEQIIGLLRIVGEIVANTIVRKRAEEALRKAHDELELRVQERTADLTEVNTQLLQEIAERIRTERELQVAKEAAEEANRAKTEFLSRMSHEIRTPLTVILSCAEMFAEGEMSGRGWSDCVETVKRNGRHLLGLVNNVLDVSKITTGKMEVERIDCDLPELLSEVRSVATYEAQAKGIDVRLDIDRNVPKRIVTDPTKLRQILLNLTGNAVKFTEQGTVCLNVSLVAPSGSGGRGGASTAESAGILRFAVQDTGIGIERDKLSTIFDAFSQADSSITRRYGGTGLGLTISKGMADLLGGTLGVQSEPGRGSTFTLELPYQPTEQSAMHKPARPGGGRAGDARLSGVEILIADDCDDVRRVMEVLLSNAGARVTGVASGRAVVERAADNEYDVVLLDIHMPDLDGISAVTQMRRQGVRAPLVAVTADATADSRRRCLEAGFNEFMFKPFQSDELVNKIRSTLDQIPPDTGGSHPTSASFTERTQAQPDGFDSPPESDAPIRSTLAARSPKLAQAAADFVYSMKLTMDRLDRALHARDFSKLTEIAHRLKGTGGIIGFLSVSEAASGLEHAARATDSDKAAARIAALRSLSTRMLAGLDGD